MDQPLSDRVRAGGPAAAPMSSTPLTPWGWSAAAAVAMSALVTSLSWASDATLMFLVPLVGVAAGVAFAAAHRRAGGGPAGIAAPIGVAAITLGAILAGRVCLAWLDLQAWNARMAEVTDDDVRSVLVDRAAARAIDRGELDAYADEYPEWIYEEADDRYAAMDTDDVERLRDEMRAEAEATTEAVSPLLLALGTLRWIGLVGFLFLGLAVAAAFRTTYAALAAEPEFESDPVSTATVQAPRSGAPSPRGPSLPEPPRDPLEGTAAGGRSLIGEQDESRRAA